MSKEDVLLSLIGLIYDDECKIRLILTGDVLDTLTSDTVSYETVYTCNATTTSIANCLIWHFMSGQVS